MRNADPGNYRILEQLGEGGMGTVFLAEHRKTGHRVALKSVKLATGSLLGSIRREIQALGRLRHPGIVRIQDSGIQNGMPWYAMELIHGTTLAGFRNTIDSEVNPRPQTSTPAGSTRLGDWSRTLANEPAPPPAETLELGAAPTGASPFPIHALPRLLDLAHRLCQALAYLHGEGLVHRDLKPGNVIVQADGRPILVDFGLAAELRGEASRERLTTERGHGGTVAYMAPEQLNGDTLDARADLYALGCILYELIAGRHPFANLKGPALLWARMTEEPPPLRALAPETPEPLAGLISRLLRREPQARLGFAADAARILEELGARPDSAACPTPKAYVYRPQFLGRAAELAFLRQRLGALGRTKSRGKGGVVLVGGESGVGKTRLLSELVREAHRNEVEVLAGECAELGRSALHSMRGPLLSLADRCRELGAAETRRLFGSRLRLLAAYQPELRELGGWAEEPEPPELPAREARHRVLRALHETMAEAFQARPLLLILEDLQWADELSLEWIELATRLEAKGLLVIGSYRTEELGAELRRLLALPGLESLELRRFEEQEIGRLAGDMLALPQAPSSLGRFLARQAEGNPFFAAEYVIAAVEEGLFWRDAGGAWQVGEPGSEQATAADFDQLPLPGTLRQLVGRRLAGLSREAAEIALAVGIVGRETTPGLARRISGLSESLWLRGVQELIVRQVLEDSERPRFVHGKLREVACDQMPPDSRPAWHRRAAEAMEAEPDWPASELGWHWEQAGESERAATWYLKAARQASSAYAHQEAETLYTAALRLMPDRDEARLEALIELGDKVLALRGRSAEAEVTLERACGLAQEWRLPKWEAYALRALGYLRNGSGRPADARELYERAIEAARRAGDPKSEGLALGFLAILHREQGRFTEAYVLCLQALALHRADADRANEAGVLLSLAILHAEQGQTQEARRLFEESLELHRQIGDLQGEATLLGNLAILEDQKGRFEAARELYEQALELHRRVGARRSEGHLLGNLGNLLGDLGRTQAAADHYQQALDIDRELGNRRMEGIHLGSLGGLRQEQGDLTEAEKSLEQALDLLRQVGDRRSEAAALRRMAGLRRAQGRLDESRTLFEQALSLNLKLNNQQEAADCLVGLASLERTRHGRLEEAERLLQRAEGIFEQGDNGLGLVLALCERGRLALEQGGSADAPLRQARAIVSRLGLEGHGGAARAIEELALAIARQADARATGSG